MGIRLDQSDGLREEANRCMWGWNRRVPAWGRYLDPDICDDHKKIANTRDCQLRTQVSFLSDIRRRDNHSALFFGAASFVNENSKPVLPICRFQIFSKLSCALFSQGHYFIYYFLVARQHYVLGNEWAYLLARGLLVDPKRNHDCSSGFEASF